MSSVQSLSRVRLFVTPWTAAHQASLSITNSGSPLKPMHWVGDAIQPSHPLLSPSPPAFSLSQHQSVLMSQFFATGGQSIGALASASVLPMNIQDLFPLGLTGLISLQPKGLSRVLPGTTVWKHQFLGSQPLWSNSHILNDYWKNHSFDYTDLCQQSDVSAF